MLHSCGFLGWPPTGNMVSLPGIHCIVTRETTGPPLLKFVAEILDLYCINLIVQSGGPITPAVPHMVEKGGREGETTE